MTAAFLLAGRRTPIGRRGGVLADEHVGDLLAGTMVTAVDAAGVEPADVDQVIVGCVTKTGDQANNVARTAWLSAGLPQEVPGVTVDAKCGSSQQAVHYAAALVTSGAVDVVLCGGIEHMSRHPLGEDIGDGMGDAYSPAYRSHYEVTSQGEAAERIADLWGLDRARCDQIAVASQERAAAAVATGRFDCEISPVGGVETDQGPRPSTLESLGRLQPVFRPEGVLTPGNSSQISDGASCVVVASDAYVRTHGLAPLAEIEHQQLVGVDPVLKLTGPIPATQRILKRADIPVSGIDTFEVNEAFASVLGAWLADIDVPLEAVNVNGGAIALGHPVGATGTRLLLTAAHELRLRGKQRALVTMCCGGGLGTATVLRAA
ncbi:MAG: acetyl-CoA C-acyltransferase [Streptosporangiales bacterium]|nr:acetyl-CoA C-acyltransferase [Streptosporangiales bacterium]